MNFYEFYNLINESMNVTIKGVDLDEPLDSILNTIFHLEKKLYDLFVKFNDEQKSHYQQNRVPEYLAPDGDDAFQKSGIINFYLKPFHPSVIDKFVQAIKYYLQEANIKYGQFYEEDSKSMGGKVIRIPILELPKVDDNRPPSLNLANANADLIFSDVLGFRSDGYGYSIPAAELLIKIDNYPHEMADFNARPTTTDVGRSGAVFQSFGYSGDQIRQRLNQIREIAKWAIDNGYDTIHVA